MQNENPNPNTPKQPPTEPIRVSDPPVKTERFSWKWATAVAIFVIFAGVDGYLIWHHYHKTGNSTASNSAASQTPPKASQPASTVQGLQLDPAKNYGNKYANGILPVGDGKYQTTGAKTGYVYVCQGYANNLATQAGGAGRQGPWFMNNGTEYNINQKLHVQGSVNWQPQFDDNVSGSTRTITSNDLPNHPTGIFPIKATDPAYAYDKNPNSITAQNFTYNLPANPTYGSPQCEGGQVGVMLTGVALFSGFDAGGRDAGAWEIQDGCDGHPQSGGIYHYHTLSSCIKDTSVKTVIGFALDGFPITGPQVGSNNILTTSDLDECHGLTSQIVLDGKTVTSYHYVMTQDFPYSVSCYRNTPIQPPGQQGGAQHP